MSTKPPRTIACPACANVNPYEADECVKCGLALAPIRAAMGGAGGGSPATEPPQQPPRPNEPAPPLPQLPARGAGEKVGNYVDSWRFLIRGMGDRAGEIAARFFKQLSDRGINGLTLATGDLVITNGGKSSRRYYFAERDLGKDALATLAVRIAPEGTDLFVEWRHYTLPSLGYTRLKYSFWPILIGAGFVYSNGGAQAWALGGLVAIGVGIAVALWKGRKESLEGFQSQDSTAFQLAVRAAIEEAIDLAGISKALIHQVPKEGDRERRLI